MKRRKIIFGIGSGLLLLIAIALVLNFSIPITRRIFTEKGNFSKDTFDKSIFLDAEKNKSVILNLGPVQGYKFFLNKYEIKSLAYFLLTKQDSLVISVKDDNNHLIDKIDITRHIKPGDYVVYEFIGDNAQEGKSLKIFIYRYSTLSIEKIPIFI